MNHFLDIGANVGNTFDYWLSLVPDFDGWSIWCFEPSPRHLTALTQKANSLRGLYEITICPFGLSDSYSALAFHEKDNPECDSFIDQLTFRQHRFTNQHNGYQLISSVVPVVDFIDRFIPEGRMLMKLDCEGSEYPILASLLRRPDLVERFDGVYIEWHCDEQANLAHELAEAYLKLGVCFQPWEF